MNNEWDELKSMWQKTKEEKQIPSRPDINELIALGESRRKSTIAAHYGNALIMGASWIVLIFFFGYLYSFQAVLSNIGIALMIGGLGLRIVIELFSTVRSKRVKLSDTTVHSVQNTLSFYRFRKRIHGPVTFIIVALYIIGFYMLSPEFSHHISLTWLIVMDIGALVVAIVLIKVISKGVRQELRDLEKMVELQKILES